MPNGNKTVMFEGKPYAFPLDATDQEIGDTLNRHVASAQPGAMQSFKGGPVVNAKNLTPGQQTEPTLGSLAREGTLGAFSGAGISETKNPVMDTLKNLLQSFGTMMGSGTWTGEKNASDVLNATPPVAIGKGIYSGLKDVYGGGTRGGIGPDPNVVAHGIGSLGGTAASLGLLKKTPEAVADPLAKGSMQRMGQEVMGQGPSKINVLSDQHAHAIATQQHIATVADAVHQDAQAAMAKVSQAVDAAKPEGAFDKGEIGQRLKAKIGDTLSDTSQLPKSVQKLMPTEAVGKQVGPSIGGKTLDLAKPEDMAAYEKYKKSGAFTPEEVAKYEGKATGSMTFEEVKQARSDLGKQMQNLQGTPKAAASAAYGELSKVLREGARDAGMEPDWIDANARWKNYLDDFHRSPVAKTLNAENAHDIMEPLSGKSRMQVRGILEKYTPFGLDMDKINQEIAGFGTGETVLKMSNPTKMDLLLARMSPSAVVLRQLGPRLFRNPSVIRAIGGEGFEPANIKPNKIYPTKEAAAATLKGKGIPQGKPTMFGGEVGGGEWESPEEAARRGASGEDPKLKSIRRHYEKERD